MVERIRQILQTRQLSPTQFADALGLARPIISHVLSGRNKPSLEVVQKIIAAFPDISLPWLLSGQGPMLAATTSQPTAPAAAASLDAGESNKAVAIAPQRAKRTIARNLEATMAPPVTAAAAPSQPIPAAAAPLPPTAPAPEPLEALQPAPPVVEAQPGSAPAVAVAATQNASQVQLPPAVPSTPPESLSAFAEPGKTIRRIVIFYYDGTFSAYQPELPN